MRVFFVVDVDHEFKDLSEAATWLEGELDRSGLNPKVVAYRYVDDMVYDRDDACGAWATKPRLP